MPGRTLSIVANANSILADGTTVLYHVAYHGSAAVVETLFRAGADVDGHG